MHRRTSSTPTEAEIKGSERVAGHAMDVRVPGLYPHSHGMPVLLARCHGECKLPYLSVKNPTNCLMLPTWTSRPVANHIFLAVRGRDRQPRGRHGEHTTVSTPGIPIRRDIVAGTACGRHRRAGNQGQRQSVPVSMGDQGPPLAVGVDRFPIPQILNRWVMGATLVMKPTL